MLKRRIIPIELLSGGRLVKTRQFADPRDVGDPVKSSKVYSDQDADELILLLIDRNCRELGVLEEVVGRIAEHCFVPLTAGGGVSALDDASRLFAAGADKVIVNSAAYRDSSLLEAIATRFGRQALVAGIDVRQTADGYALYSDCGRVREPVSLEQHLERLLESGVGEVMIQAIDRDGVMGGYDLDLLKRVVGQSSVPVIAAAGAGHFMHLKEAFESGVDAAACGSLFNFGDNNPLRAKSFLKNHGVPLKRI